MRALSGATTVAPATSLQSATADEANPAGQLAAQIRQATTIGLALGLPLAFNPFGTLGFETFKIALIRLAAVLVALTYAMALWRRPALVGHGASTRSKGVLVAASAYLFAATLATLCSIDPLQSLLGSYYRSQGLLTLIALMLVAGAVATASQPSQERLIDCLLLGSLPVCLYALVQHFRLDPLPWLGRTLGPSSTLGSSTSLGAYLAMLTPLTLARAASAARQLPTAGAADRLLRDRAVRRYVALLVLAGIQTSVTLVSGVRGALLGLGAGLGVMALLLVARSTRRERAWVLLGLLGAALLATVALNLSAPPFADLRDTSPYIERLATISPDEVSGRERLLIWRAAFETWAASGLRLAVGFGPETQMLMLEAHFPVEIANRLPDFRFDRVHNHQIDQLLTTGALGLGAYAALLAAAVRAGWQATTSKADPWLPVGLLAAFAAHVVESAFAFTSASTLLVFWLSVGMLASFGRPMPPRATRRVAPPTWIRRGAAAVMAVASLVLVPVAVSPVLADVAYTRALAYEAGEDPIGQTAWLRRAAILAPDRDLYPLAVGISLAEAAKSETSASRRSERLAEAATALRRAAQQQPADPYHRFHLGQLLELRADAEHLPAAANEAIHAYQLAAEISPSRAVFLDAAGLALHRQGRDEEALVYYRAATGLAGPEAERAARIGDCWLALGHDDEARASYEAALRLAPRSAPAQAGRAAISYRQGDLQGALEQARLAARFQSREWRYREALARLEQEAGHPREALLEARAAARFAPPWERERLRGLVEELRREVAR